MKALEKMFTRSFPRAADSAKLHKTGLFFKYRLEQKIGELRKIS